jgi:molybdopterin-guanine dinucleotide biosynthesis protein A
VANAEQSFSQLAQFPRLRFAVDIYPGRGPLGGIYTGLAASTTVYNLVVACDMPFLNPDLLNYMIQVEPAFDLVVPRVGKLTEPLHAVYSKNCLSPIENLLKENKLQVYKLFSLVKVRYVEAVEIDRFDPKHLSFFNINTETDLKKAKELLNGELAATH